MDTKVLNWGQPLEAVYSDGEVKPVNRKDITKRGKDQWWVQTGPNVYLVDADTGRTADGFPTIRNVSPKEVEWGPEIKVDGKRPEWLVGDEPFKVWEAWPVGDLNGPCEGYYWNEVTAIVLPADHEHYKKTVIRTALEQRMEDLVRKIAQSGTEDRIGKYEDARAEARAILAELEPVPSPDLLEAREIMAGLYPDTADKIRNGDWDNNAVRDCLQGLRRGRALERGE